MRPAAPPPQLSAQQEAEVAANKAFVLDHMPDLLPMLRALVDEGMIDGWRSVKQCVLLDGSLHE